MTAHVWIVEYREGKRWLPCVGVCETKREAKREKRDSKAAFPKVRYRFRKYVRASK